MEGHHLALVLKDQQNLSKALEMVNLRGESR
jgi:hypothetical protein